MDSIFELLIIVITTIGMVSIAAALAWYLMCLPRRHR